MQTRQLRQFIAIAEEGSLSAAASRIGVAQPSLSQLVKTLEDHIGVELLVRSPQGIQLTDAGRTLLDHARAIVAATDAAVDEVRLAGAEAVGTVAFGLPSSVSMVLSVPLAETVRLSLPRVSLRGIEAMSGFIHQWLIEGTIDLAILYEIDTLRHFETQLLLAEQLHFVTAADDWPLDTPPGSPVTLASVAALDLVLPSPSHGLRMMINRFAKAHALSLNVVIEMDALTQIKALVARGSGYSILAPAAVHDMVNAGTLVSAPIVAPTLERPVYLVRNFQRPLTRATKEVRALTLDVVEDLVQRGIWPATRMDHGNSR